MFFEFLRFIFIFVSVSFVFLIAKIQLIFEFQNFFEVFLI